jgi:hypothetical protein
MQPDERDSVEKSLLSLEAENRLLKAKLEQYDQNLFDQIKSAISADVAQLKESNDRIAKQIGAYAPIAEDVWGLKVFEKAKTYLNSWITLGGVTALVAGLALFGAAWKYAIDVIDAKIKSISSAEISTMVQKETERQVGTYFKEHSDEYNRHVEELTLEIVRQNSATLVAQVGYKLIPETSSPKTSIVATSLLVDYASEMQPVRDMGQEGSITGFAIAAASTKSSKRPARRCALVRGRFTIWPNLQARIQGPRFLTGYVYSKPRAQSSKMFGLTRLASMQRSHPKGLLPHNGLK